MDVHMSLPSSTSLPSPLPPTRWVVTEQGFWASCITQQIPTGYQFHSACVSMLLSQFGLPSPSLAGSACQFSESVPHCCPANRFISAIFLDSIDMLPYIYLFFSFWLISLCIIWALFSWPTPVGQESGETKCKVKIWSLSLKKIIKNFKLVTAKHEF